MKMLIDFNHPADVHMFKNLIKIREKKGDKILSIVRDKECSIQLCKAYNLNFLPRKGYKSFKKLFGMVLTDRLLLSQAKKFRPDILLGGPGNCYIAQTSFLTGIPSIIFDDTEHSTIQNMLTFPFAKRILTPKSYYLQLSKQKRVNSFKELAYLHPNNFSPNEKIKNMLKQPYFILRFVAWDASHDFGKHGISIALKKRLVELLEKKGNVYISSEGQMPAIFRKYLINIPAEDMHSALYYADGYVGEGGTMAAEAAVLGVPSVMINPLNLGYIEELKEYGLLYTFSEITDKDIDSISGLISSKEKLKPAREKMLKEKDDLNIVMEQEIMQMVK